MKPARAPIRHPRLQAAAQIDVVLLSHHPAAFDNLPSRVPYYDGAPPLPAAMAE
jgi:hypothetical protein